MTDASLTGAVPAAPKQSILGISDNMKRRRSAEVRFQAYGIFAVVLSLSVLVVMLWTIFSDGANAFRQTKLDFTLAVDPAIVDPTGNRDPVEMAAVTTIGYGRLLSAELITDVRARNYDVPGLTDEMIGAMVSRTAAAELRNMVLANPEIAGTTIDIQVLTNGRIDGYLKGRVTRDSALRDGQVTPEQLELVDQMRTDGFITMPFNWAFITSPDASDQRPEAAGLGVSIIGSAYLMLIVLVLALPIGVAASIYLEEFAPKNRWTELIEVNISNLAAVPSIVYGILALAIFINFMALPVSSSIVGGLALTLMTLPTIIIATRASLRAVPPSIRDAALGVGASKMQMVFHHVLPLAMPGILTGTILGLATALGETAPLLLIGMVAFVNNFPGPPPAGLLDPATALPVQVFGWSQRADPAFVERASGAIIVLLVFLMIMNIIAIILRRRFERRW